MEIGPWVKTQHIFWLVVSRGCCTPRLGDGHLSP